MEDANSREDVQGNVVRQAFMRPSGALKPTSSGRSTPRSSPSYRRMRAPRRDSRGGPWKQGLFGANRLFLWLILITGWAYVGFFFQSKWSHRDKSDAELARSENELGGDTEVRRVVRGGVAGDPVLLDNSTAGNGSKIIGVTLVKKGSRHTSPNENATTSSRKRGKRPAADTSTWQSDTNNRPNVTTSTQNRNLGSGFGVSRRNTSYGLFIGPFGKIEDSVLGWPAQKLKATCDRKTLFAHFVKSRRFVLIIHELSMTGAPLSMMELATELLGCGATVSVIVLSRRGGLLAELDRRGIEVLDDRGELSIRTAKKADLIVAGSAVCSSWIEQYLSRLTLGCSQILWWIMENRREYFDRSKHVLDKVPMLMFLTKSQSQQWLTWCGEEGIKLKKQPLVVPLSVNDELACIAGITCSFNTPYLTVEKMKEKRNILRLAVRKEMGLSDNDMLVMSLSSINPGKGQRLLVESLAAAMYEEISASANSSNVVLQDVVSDNNEPKDNNLLVNSVEMAVKPKRRRRKRSRRARSSVTPARIEATHNTHSSRNLLSENEATKENAGLKILIGSVGSKSNKPLYVKGILKFLSLHPNLVKSVIWTPATTRVASLYAAADAYVINAQGVGETFGRVTIEAMAFGLPVLGTEAGGTKEIVEDRVTGLLHPVGREGLWPLAQNLRFLLSNSSAREQLGRNGRLKVERMYLKHHMYEKLAQGISECIKIK